jgi:hypothetical protein
MKFTQNTAFYAKPAMCVRSLFKPTFPIRDAIFPSELQASRKAAFGSFRMLEAEKLGRGDPPASRAGSNQIPTASAG